MKKQNNILIFIVLFACMVLSSYPLFGNTIYGVDVHDTFFHTQRIMSIQNALKSGQFPVRIYAEIYNGYGYGAPLFYPDLFLYIPAVLCMMGIPLAASFNGFLILINLATILVGYFSFKGITKDKTIGVIATLFYHMSIYRLLDLYTRASVGECLALVFCPLVLWGFTAIKRGEYEKWFLLAIAYTGLLQSHILTFVIMVVVGFVYVLGNAKRFLNKQAICALLKAVVIAVLANIWFLLPLLQVSHMNVIAFLGTESYWQTGASFKQLFDVKCTMATGREFYNFAETYSMVKTPGMALLIGAGLLVVALLFSRKRVKEADTGLNKAQVTWYLILGVIATLMTTYVFPWKLVQKIGLLKKFVEKFQFMWRWNILAILFLSIAAAYGVYYLFIANRKYENITIILVAVFVSIFAGIYMHQYVSQATEYNSEMAMEKGYMDRLYVVPGFNTECKGDFASNIEGIEITNVNRGYLDITADFKYEIKPALEEPAYIEAPITYYPGYKAYIDGEEVETECSIWGVVRVHIPEDVMDGTLYVVYEESTMNQIANIISLLTVLGILAYGFWKGVYKRWRQN